MKVAAILLTTLSATGVFAAPAPASDSTNVDGVSQMAAATPQWTIANMKRVCTSNAQACAWTFGINTHTSPVTQCAFNVTGNPASETNSGVRTCGIYSVSTGWSGQFGPGNGFTTLAVVNNVLKQIIYPAYTDTQLAAGTVVTPNQSYAPQNLP